MKRLLLAMQFLTIIPVSVRGTVTEKDMAACGAFFPLVGAMQGTAAALAAFLLIRFFPPEVTAAFVVLLLVAVNGGFHLDGLADSFDGIAVKSSGDGAKDREKRLAVMKDSTTGAIGVTAIVIAVLLKYALFVAFLKRYPISWAAGSLFLMPLFSKWMLVPVMLRGKSARPTGLGRMFIDGTGPGVLALSSFLLLAVYCVDVIFVAPFPAAWSAVFPAVACSCLYAFAMLWVRFCSSKFGGLTGDTVGAAGEMGDIIFLVIIYLWFYTLETA